MLTLSPTLLPDVAGTAANLLIRNGEALSQAIQAMVKGAVAQSEQQMQLLRSLTEQSMKTFVDLVGEPNPKASVRKGFDAVRASMENATAASNILSELSVRNGAAAAKVIQDRTYAALEEMQSLAIQTIDATPAARART